MLRTENLLPPPAWADPFGAWYRHWAVAVALGVVTMGVFGYMLQGEGLLTVLLVVVLVPGTVLNAWLGYQGRAVALGDSSVLEGRVLDGRLELAGLASPLARRRWATFGPGVLTLQKVGATRQGAVLYSLGDEESEVRFLHDSDVGPSRLSRLVELARGQGVHVVLED
ncbi:hypothetical protein [Demequina capsici]|uniref:Uncharacterized protein n=1 Tax=Demequina capsici TaxID=3075620 RepID=A0AA96J8T1_9MICO|nr:hypothetical protein [Demequina sp. OYTSA14]WNM25378.1 hypothetical protein RN606_04310 [Demequina sp. OYTSA14]